MTPDLDALPDLPRDTDGPVFREPAEATAFALAVRLHEQGLFTWQEWATVLSEEINAAQADGDPDLGDTYYQHWTRALERLVGRPGLRGGSDGVGPADRPLAPGLPEHPPRPAHSAVRRRLSL